MIDPTQPFTPFIVTAFIIIVVGIGVYVWQVIHTGRSA
jgi:hypothetical protein